MKTRLIASLVDLLLDLLCILIDPAEHRSAVHVSTDQAPVTRRAFYIGDENA